MSNFDIQELCAKCSLGLEAHIKTPGFPHAFVKLEDEARDIALSYYHFGRNRRLTPAEENEVVKNTARIVELVRRATAAASEEAVRGAEDRLIKRMKRADGITVDELLYVEKVESQLLKERATPPTQGLAEEEGKS